MEEGQGKIGENEVRESREVRGNMGRWGVKREGKLRSEVQEESQGKARGNKRSGSKGNKGTKSKGSEGRGIKGNQG